MRIQQTDSIAVVVDIQSRLFPHIVENNKLEKNCLILLAGLQALNIPILLTEQYPQGLGPTIESIQSMLREFKPLEKRAFSCCAEKNFTNILNDSGRKSLILCGIEAHVCVLQTAVDLKAEGYNPVVIADCISSRKESDKELALKRMQQENILLSGYESILFELCAVSGTETFKTISRLVK